MFFLCIKHDVTMTIKEDFLSLYELEDLNVLLDDMYAGFLKSERGSADENETAFWLIQLVKRWLAEPESKDQTHKNNSNEYNA